MKNKTGCKILDVIESDPRIDEAYRDSDGYWLEPAPGWTCELGGAHGGHEMTATALLKLVRWLESCGPCAECAAVLARRCA